MYSKEDILTKQKREKKKDRIAHAKQIKEYSETHDKKELIFSSSNIYIWQSLIKDVEEADKFKEPCHAELYYGTIAEVIRKYPVSDSVCAMCICNYTEAGGQFIEGASRTDEECLCLDSNLYAIQTSDYVQKKFYIPNNTLEQKRIYGPKILYIPDVVIYNTPRDRCADVMLFDVPFDPIKRKKWEENGKKRSETRTEYMTAELRNSLYHRIDAVISVAAQQKPDVLICGNLGSEDNGNDLWISFLLFKELIEGKYAHTFKKAIMVLNSGLDYLYLSAKLRQEEEAANKKPAEEQTSVED